MGALTRQPITRVPRILPIAKRTLLTGGGLPFAILLNSQLMVLNAQPILKKAT